MICNPNKLVQLVGKDVTETTYDTTNGTFKDHLNHKNIEQGVTKFNQEIKNGKVVRTWNIEVAKKKHPVEVFYKEPKRSLKDEEPFYARSPTFDKNMPPEKPRMNPGKRMTIGEYQELAKNS